MKQSPSPLSIAALTLLFMVTLLVLSDPASSGQAEGQDLIVLPTIPPTPTVPPRANTASWTGCAAVCDAGNRAV